MIEPHEMERDRGKVIVIAILAVVAIFLLSQVVYPPALPYHPQLDTTPVDGTLRPKPHLPKLKNFHPFRKREYREHPQDPGEVQAARP